MSNPTALVPPVTLTLRGRPYVVTARESSVMPYTLTGKRGAEFYLVRNVHSKLLIPTTLKANSTLEGVALDDLSEPGTFRVVRG